jgi:hypothetical protein
MAEFEDQLVSELWARDVRFLMGEQLTPTPTLDAAHLIASLAQSKEARLRLAIGDYGKSPIKPFATDYTNSLGLFFKISEIRD